MASTAATTISGVARSVIILSSLIAAVGAAIIVSIGYFNPLRFGPFFVFIGTVGFFIPGLLGAVGGFFLQREHRPWPWRLALAGVVMQFVVAGFSFVMQFFVTPISLVPLVVCAVWTEAASLLVWRLIRVRGAISSDAQIRRGFLVETPEPSDAQIVSVREK